MELDPRRIPDFVLRSPAERGFGVPLLMFHWLAPDELDGYLSWLRNAGYRSLRAAEVAAIACAELEPPRRAVALTFDDGVYNNWAVVAPLLRRQGFTGIAFVVPRLLRDGPKRPTLDDARAGRISLPLVLDDERQGRHLTWDEARHLDAEGVLEIESHTYDHAQVFTAPEIVDFQHPRRDGRPRYPWLWSACGAEPHDPLWGAPVYPLAPRMLARRYHDDGAFRYACRRFVEIRGERGFFADVTWREELSHFARTERSRFGPGRLESPEETSSERLLTLRRAREVLEQQLGRPVQHVALPWSRGAADAPRLIREAGYRSGYTRERPSWRLRPPSDPCDLGRLEGFWLESLPGTGRVSLGRRVLRTLSRHLPLRSR